MNFSYFPFGSLSGVCREFRGKITQQHLVVVACVWLPNYPFREFVGGLTDNRINTNEKVMRPTVHYLVMNLPSFRHEFLVFSVFSEAIFLRRTVRISPEPHTAQSIKQASKRARARARGRARARARARGFVFHPRAARSSRKGTQTRGSDLFT